MYKGITPVIAIIMLLLITVSIASFAFVYLTGISTTAGGKTTESAEHITGRLATQFTIEHIDKNKVDINNIGATTIEADGLRFYVNNVPVDSTGPEIAPTGFGIYTLDDAQLAMQPGQSDLRVIASGVSLEQKTDFYGRYTVGHWRFDEGSGTNAGDSSGHGNHGVLRNMEADDWIDGQVGKALKFDGGEYIALDMSYSIQGEISELTVCAWFNTSFVGASYSDNWAFIDFDRSEYFIFFIRGDDGRLGFGTTRSTGGTNDFYSNTVGLNDGKWHFACAVYDGTDKILYLDGGEDVTLPNPQGGDNLGSGDFTRYGFIGDGSEADVFDGARNNAYYEGAIDELVVYSVARPMDMT